MPEKTFPKLNVVRRSGSERFRSGDSDADFDLLEFWQWSMSDLVSNTTRGALAEYIVARAVGASTVEARDPWAAFDLETPEGVKIEVKSSSYLQGWAQAQLSRISFSIAPSYAWNAEIGDFEDECKRQADIYVFSLLAHRDQSTIDLMDLDQWEFYVLATVELDEHFGSQKTVTLSRLKEFASPIHFGELKAAVSQAWYEQVNSVAAT